MNYELGKNVSVGNKILLKTGWKKILQVKEGGVEVEGGYIEYGQTIYGWKIK